MSDSDNLEQIGHAMMLAWRRIKTAQARMWGDWMTIGEGLMEGRRWAMRKAGTNKPEGKGYAMAFGDWLKRYKVDDMDKSDRAKLLQLMEDRPGVEEWRATLTDSERRNLNNPTIAWRKWKAATNNPDADAGLAKRLDRIAHQKSGIDWNPDTEAEMRKSLSEAAAENQKLRAEAAELRTRVGAMEMIEKGAALQPELTLLDHLRAAVAQFELLYDLDDDDAEEVVDELNELQWRFTDYNMRGQLEWHTANSMVRGHSLHFDNKDGWEASRYVITPMKGEDGRFSHYIIEEDGKQIDDAKSLDVAKGIAQRHADRNSAEDPKQGSQEPTQAK